MIYKNTLLALLCAFVIGTLAICSIHSESLKIQENQDLCQDSYTGATYTYSSAAHSCVRDLVDTCKVKLCDPGCQSCKGVCFDPINYKCQNGQVLQMNQESTPEVSDPDQDGDDDDSSNNGASNGQQTCIDSYTGATYFYSPSAHSCVIDLVDECKFKLCDPGCQSCKGVCFDPINYKCENEKIEQIDQEPTPEESGNEGGEGNNGGETPSDNLVCKDSYSGEDYVFSPNVHDCVRDLVEPCKNRLCDPGCQSCKGVCFDPINYKCQNGQVLQMNQEPTPEESHDDDDNGEDGNNNGVSNGQQICVDSFDNTTYYFLPSAHSCVVDLVDQCKYRLCDPGCESCNGVCFDPQNYKCENGQVAQKLSDHN